MIWNLLRSSRRVLILFGLLAIGTAPASADVITDWNAIALNAIKTDQASPPIASRALAMMHGAMYDSVLATLEKKPYRHYLVERPIQGPASAEAAAAQAAYQVLLANFQGQKPTLDRALAVALNTIDAGEAKERGIEVGSFVGAQYVLWRAGDLKQAKAEYQPNYGAGKWRPTPPDYRPAMLPGWATLTPFAMESPSQFRQPAPPALDSEVYTRDLDEVQRLGTVASEERTEEQTAVARFWEAGTGTVTPPGQWNQIAQILAGERQNDLLANARMFALLNVAMADAAIACWDMKYEFNCWRPVTAIRRADTDGNPATEPDTAWTPLLTTPPFPSCTSGHSTFSGAAAVMLALFYGNDEIPFVAALEGTGGQRSFEKLSEAAVEAGRSRIYGGIHFQFENEAGLNTGEDLAKYVFTHYMTPNESSAATDDPAKTESDKETPLAEDQPQTTQKDEGWRATSNSVAAAPTAVVPTECVVPVAPPVVCDVIPTPSPVAVVPGAAVVAGVPLATPQPHVTAYRYVNPLTGEVTLYYPPQPTVVAPPVAH